MQTENLVLYTLTPDTARSMQRLILITTDMTATPESSVFKIVFQIS